MPQLSRDHLQRQLTDALEKLMSEYGYKKEDDSIMYNHCAEFYDIFLSMGLAVNGANFYKKEAIGRRIIQVELLWEDLMELVQIKPLKNRPSISISMAHAFPDLVNQSYYDKVFNGIKCDASEDGIHQYVTIYRSILDNHLLPAARKYQDIREINRFAMQSFKPTKEIQGFLGTDGDAFRRLIIAKLAGDGRFEELYDHEMQGEGEYLEIAEKKKGFEFLKNYPVVFREIYKRLKNVSPLENPVLK